MTNEESHSGANSAFRIPLCPITLISVMHDRIVRILSVALFVTLLTWGVFSTLVYLGVPVHGAVYLTDSGLQSLNGVCNPGALLCRGVYTLIPMLLRTIGRAAPFIGYTFLWLLVAATLVVRTGMQSGKFGFHLVLSPLRVLLLFLASVWSLFTVLSYADIGDAPLRRLVEPLDGVYLNVGDEGLQELRRNFHRLEDAGCLRQVGMFAHEARAFHMTTLCMQKFFVTRVFSQMLWAIFILFEMLILGYAVLRRFKVSMAPLTEGVLSVGIGAGLWVALLWFLAVIHFYVSGAIWALLIAVPALCRHSLMHWLRMLRSRWTVSEPIWSITIFIGWLLLSYFALNFLTVIRPFPIGWDDLGSYVNRPNLLVSYGKFIHSMAPFQWEYLTAVGFAIFGFGSAVGATAAMVINWTQGVIATLTVIAFGRAYFGKGKGLLAGLLFYSLPLIGHFSYADMKIDNAVFAMGALGMFALFLGIFPPDRDDGEAENLSSSQRLRWMAIAGACVGFAFGMKVTAVMVLLALIVILGGVMLHWSAAIGAGAFAVVALATRGGLDFASIGQRLFGSGTEVQTRLVLHVFVLFGVLCAAAALYKGRARIKTSLLAGAVFCIGFFAVITPWVWHNNIQRDHLLPTQLMLGAPDKISLRHSIKGEDAVSMYGEPVRNLPAELKVDANHPACKASGHKEEVDRYWGFRIGWAHYLTLPWRTVLNLDSAGYYVTTMPALFLFPLLLLLPYFWSKRGRWLRWMWIGTLFILLEWMFTANGIPWYGVGVFLGLVLTIEALVARAPDVFSRSLAGVLIAIALFSNFAHRFWQFDQQRNLFEYPIGRASAEVMRERTIPHYDDIAEIALELYRTRPERPYLYRVGTFIPYFIPKNLEVIGIVDHQLDVFNCLYQERDTELTLKRLQALGFSSVVFDTNTATIERDNNGSLHKKVQAFVDFLNDPKAGVQVVVNDTDGGVVYVILP